MRKPVVAHAIRGYLATTETFVGNQVTTLLQYDPVVLCHHRGPNASYDINAMHVMAEHAGILGKLSYQMLRTLSQSEIRTAVDWLRKQNPALWHFHFGVDAAYFLPLYRRLGIPAVVSLYGYDVSSFPNKIGGLGKQFMRPMFREMDCFLAMSEDMKRDAVASGAPDAKVIVHYHGINTQRFRFDERSYASRSPFTILCVGTLEPKKGQHHLVKALAELRRERPDIPARVVLVGTGPLQSELDALVRQFNLQLHVEFAGYVPHTNGRLEQYYQNADVFVHFSTTQPDNDKEGIPGTLVEAMASGLPVVTTRHAGIPEVVTNNVNGILLDEQDTAGIAGALVRLYDSENLRSALGRAAALHAHQNLDYRSKTSALECIYERVVCAHREKLDPMPTVTMKTPRSKIYNMLPQRAKVVASEMAFRFANRPYVHHNKRYHPANGLERGVVTISVDFELAWGWQYAKGLSQDCVKIGLRERAQVPLILAKMDEYNIPVTWATVGHLFLSSCSRDANGVAHSELYQIPHFENEYWKFTSGDWYQHDPCTNVHQDPAWYAPDLIEMILHAKATHEIGCHSFSHEGFGPYCPNDVAESKIDACLKVMKPFGITPRTWVFPGNDVGNFEALARKGMRTVRSFPIQPAEISLPIKRRDGMWDIHESTPIDLEGDGWDLDERLGRLKKFVDKAAETKLAAHIWFHPSLRAEQLQNLLFPLLRYCAEQREKGVIDVLTNDDLVTATEQALLREGKL
ncbi:MAG: glycosyltransferase [Ignavibacteriae bacterium]|nr:glycosyltransferase [Ignavibacteriota bacterium]